MLILVSGPSRSGKSRLCKCLKEYFKDDCFIIGQDGYWERTMLVKRNNKTINS